jgi:hypothetical protein
MGFLYGRYLKKYYTMLIRLLALSMKARGEGLLALEEEIEDQDNRFIKTGLRLIVNGTDEEVVDRVLSFMIENEKNKRERQLKKAIKQALLDIQAGFDPESIKIKYNSFMDIHNYTALSRDRTKIIEDCNGFFINARIKKYTGQKYFNACLEMVGDERTNLAYVMENKLTHEQYFDICRKAVESDVFSFAFIKADSFKTEEWLSLYTAAVNQNGMAIKYINSDLCSEQFYYELCLMALKTNSNETDSWGFESILSHTDSLKCTPEHYLEICLNAVKKNGVALGSVDESRLTPEQYSEICRVALRTGKHYWRDYPFAHVKPEHLPAGQYRELCLEAVTQNNYMLEYVQGSSLGHGEYYEICRAAFFDGKNAEKNVRLEYIKAESLEAEQYIEFCFEAVKRCDYFIHYINQAAVTQKRYEELCLMAVTQNASAIVCLENPTPKILEKALENGHGLKYIAAQTVALCLAVVTKNPEELCHVKTELFTQEEYVEICLAAIKTRTSYGFMYINDKALSIAQYLNLCQEAILFRRNVLEELNISRFSREQYFGLCLESVQRSGLTLEYVWIQKLSKRQYGTICYTAVEQDGNAFEFVVKLFCPKNIYRKCRDLLPEEKEETSKIQEETSGDKN